MRPGLLLLLAAAALPTAASAQPTAPLQTNPIDRATPQATPRVAPALQPAPLVPRTGPGAAQVVRLGEVAVSGNRALPASAFAATLDRLRGAEVPLAQLEEARIEVLRAYRAADFPFAAVDAGLTPRVGGAADLVFRVTEGFVAEVRLEGDIGPAGTQVLRFLNRLLDERPVTGAALERALLLASDIPGVAVRGVVRPLPSEPGALQLVAQVERRAVSGYVTLDNSGSRFAGPWQGLLAIGANALTEFGERTELVLFGAEGATQGFAQLNFETFIGGSGLRLRGFAGVGQSRPGSTLAAIGYEGETQVAGIGLSYPLVRRRPFSLFATGQFDLLGSEVRTGTGASSSVASRDDIRTLRGGFDMQSVDAAIPFLPAAVTAGSLRLHQGLSALGASANGDPQASRAGSRFDFTKATLDIQRTQPLIELAEGWELSLQVLAAGQYSGDILPQSEKFFLGGNRLTRGYYAGQVTGDSAIALGVELQLDTAVSLSGEAPWGLGNRLGAQFYLFHDQGRTYENGPTDQDRRLVSWGGGARLNLSNSVQLGLELAHRETLRPNGAGTDPIASDAVFFRTLIRF